MEQALVIFGGESAHPLSWMLESGFKHCFLCVLSQGHWIELNKVQGSFTVRVMGRKADNPALKYENAGYKVLTVQPQSPNIWKFNPFYGNIMVANCVGLVKAVLSMNSLALTPFSLYKELTKC